MQTWKSASAGTHVNPSSLQRSEGVTRHSNANGGPPGAKGLGGGFSEEQKQAMEQRFRDATPAQRRDMINAMPEAVRGMVRQKMREKGLEVAD
jgi:hypothetical protein